RNLLYGGILIKKGHDRGGYEFDPYICPVHIFLQRVYHMEVDIFCQLFIIFLKMLHTSDKRDT
ncbi:MAG TPA: hypothetical protein DHW02_21500, partial [Ktedonobacter sp.]|nr:hypothetical protein [Ktedonobacter sp.]